MVHISSVELRGQNTCRSRSAGEEVWARLAAAVVASHLCIPFGV